MVLRTPIWYSYLEACAWYVEIFIIGMKHFMGFGRFLCKHNRIRDTCESRTR